MPNFTLAQGLTLLALLVLWVGLYIWSTRRYKKHYHTDPQQACYVQILFGEEGNTSMSVTMNSDSPGVAATLNVTDKEGVTAKVYGVPLWASDNEAIATVTPAADGMSAVVKPVSVGTANVSVTLEGDPTAGVDTVKTSAVVNVVTPEASQASISFGEPQ